MQDVVIVAATRTAIGSFGGQFASVPAHELGATVIRALLAETAIDPASVNEVILGQVLTAGCGQNPARQASLRGGLPVSVPAMNLNKVCGSGLKAVQLGAQAIRCGDADIIIAGGQESMSLSPHLLPSSRTGQRMGHGQLIDSMIHDGLWDAFNDYHMGITAENLVEKYSISREEQDAYAAGSQQKAVAAQEAGYFDRQITAVEVAQRKGDPLRIIRDEQPRAGTTAEALAKLRPAFKKDGSVTAGNASGAERWRRSRNADERRARRTTGPAGAGTRRWLRQLRCRTFDHGHRSGLRDAQLPAQGWLVTCGPRSSGSQRSLRGPGTGGWPGAGMGPGEGQRQRRRNRPRPPDWGIRVPGTGQPAARDDSSGCTQGPGYALYRWRSGRCTGIGALISAGVVSAASAAETTGRSPRPARQRRCKGSRTPRQAHRNTTVAATSIR